MKIAHVLAASLFVLTSAGVSAQPNTIDGQTIPEGQASEVQAHCNELVAQQGTTGTQEPETTMTDAPATDAADGSANNELDVTAITLEQCQTGGFTEELTTN